MQMPRFFFSSMSELQTELVLWPHGGGPDAQEQALLLITVIIPLLS